jgi:tetratricopeptide (TPR) repeat protein
VAPKVRWAVLALLVTAPAVAAAQQQQGSARDADHLSRARALVEQKRFEAALAIYDSLLRAEPGSRDAALGRAQVLGLTGRLADALGAYEQWLDAHPQDVEAVEKLAHTFAWAGRLDEAERLFKLLAGTGSLEASRGLARIAAWRGDLVESERRWRAIVAEHPRDADAWIGLAQVLRGRNRPREVREALARAIEIDPGNRDAADQLRRVDAARAHHVDPVAEAMEDTDGNRVWMVGATAVLVTPWAGEFAVHARYRAAAIGATLAWSSHASVAASQNVGPFAFRGSFGATRLGDASTTPGGPTRDVLTGTAAASAKLGRMHLAGGVGRVAFDETAPLMRRGIVSSTVGAGVSVDFGLGLAFSTEAEHARLSGATPNSRIGGLASLSWRAPAILSLAATVRGFGYALDPAEGYFAPRQYGLAEMSARIAVGRDLGWSVTLDGGAGAQSIDFGAIGLASQAAARGGLSILYRPTPGLEWSLSGTTANAASPATSQLSSYRATGVSLRGRVSF